MSEDEIRKPVPPRKKLSDKADEAIADLQKKDLTLQKCFERLVKTEDGLFALQHTHYVSCLISQTSRKTNRASGLLAGCLKYRRAGKFRLTR